MEWDDVVPNESQYWAITDKMHEGTLVCRKE
jgi:hypothetical protein